MISATSAVPTSGAATITFYDEPWTVEVARLLLEIDEGWVGYCHDTIWSWHEETYKVFTLICCDRKWPCNSKAACIAMLQAIRTGVISMTLSNATRSSDGYAQWSLIEMRELGAQMRHVVDNESLTICWTAQLEKFLQIMTSKDTKYVINDRTTEDFAARASKYVPETLVSIDSDLPNRTLTPEYKQRTRRQAMDDAIDSADEPLLSGRNIYTKATMAARKRVRNRTVETFEDEDVSRRDNTSLQKGSATQELYGELLHLPLEGDGPSTDCSQNLAGVGQSSLSIDMAHSRRPPSAVNHATAYHNSPSSGQAPPRQVSTSMRDIPYQIEWAPTSPLQYTADQAQSVNGIAAATQQPTRKCRRVQQSSSYNRETVNSRTSSTKANAPSHFRNLNPYDRPGKLWGEFVVEVLLAERTASNEDELDYVQFVRSLYEI
ncbi:hypothetical protein KXD40_004817 [Peronospora effusa]|uniref:Uncharacterized protein n=1 Tax=Peronospora effusa TaxID=542832 RepID=A0A3M6VND6_9STRA|nr:hypothetical protein DD238_001571 [Peronospora effusa]UIZ22315.1 hypothetical protein KXD40_004817 [Peronospora effusa]CAI5708971.1 unnamed protein product [Peronospora effusa]